MRFSLVFLSVAFLLGCDSDTLPPVEDSLDYNELNITPIGAWETSCIQTSFDDVEADLWALSTYIFTSDSIVNTWEYFTDNQCSTSYTETDNLWAGFKGDYQFLQHVESSNGLKANWYEVSYTYSDIPITIEIGFHFEFEKMSYVTKDGDIYYISYTPTYNFTGAN